MWAVWSGTSAALTGVSAHFMWRGQRTRRQAETIRAAPRFETVPRTERREGAYVRFTGTVSRPGNSSNATDPVAVLTMVRERHQTEEVRGNQRKVVDRIVSERTEQNPFYMIYGPARDELLVRPEGAQDEPLRRSRELLRRDQEPQDKGAAAAAAHTAQVASMALGPDLATATTRGVVTELYGFPRRTTLSVLGFVQQAPNKNHFVISRPHDGRPFIVTTGSITNVAIDLEKRAQRDVLCGAALLLGAAGAAWMGMRAWRVADSGDARAA